MGMWTFAWAAAAGEAAPIQSSGEGLNLIIVCIDALRADHLGCYGYARPTSPFIDSLAREGLLFERAMSQSSYTRESVSALLTGIPPSLSGTGTGWYAIPNPRTPHLGELFAHAGYRTGFFSDSAAFLETPFGDRFSEKGFVPTSFGASGSGPALSQRALEFVKKNADQKFMMYVHYLDPHEPYEPRPEYYLRFAKEIYPKPINLIGEVRPELPRLTAEGFGPGEPRFEDLITRYDGEIYAADEAVRMLFDGLREQGVLDKTLVVLTADHGEEFLDHGFIEHGWSLYNEVLHVPLIFWRPGVVRPGRAAFQVSHGQVFPTLISWMKVPYELKGYLYAPLFQAAGEAAWEFGTPGGALAETLLETRLVLHAVMSQDYKYIAAQKWLTPAECSEASKHQAEGREAMRKGVFPFTDPWGPAVHEALYNLKTDPGETKNLLNDAPEQVKKMREFLESYRALCPKAAAPARSERGTLSPELEQRRRELGY